MTNPINSDKSRKSINMNCRYYNGEKPCSHSKFSGAVCGDCEKFHPVSFRILVIKLGAPGDVLRTTPILHELRKRHPDSQITWITEKDSFPLLQHNPHIDRLWETSTETICRLQTEQFDLVLSLENAGKCASMATIAKSPLKKGYILTEAGQISPIGSAAETYLEMAVFDKIKKANTRTYQDLVFDICGYRFNPDFHRIILRLTAEEKEFANMFARRNGLLMHRPVIGINLGSGGRWPMKRWQISSYAKLIEQLTDEADVSIIILGGPEESKISSELRHALSIKKIKVTDGRCDNTLRQFMALVDLCDTVITGDTMAMHIATALDKHVIAMFGPTSATEIEMYGRGAKLVAPVPCQCCYRQHCTHSPTCMESILVNDIYKEVIATFKLDEKLQVAV